MQRSLTSGESGRGAFSSESRIVNWRLLRNVFGRRMQNIVTGAVLHTPYQRLGIEEPPQALERLDRDAPIV